MPKRTEPPRKSTVFTLRLDPKLRFALDLLARKRHRTMTNVIEWALHKAIEDQDNGLFVKGDANMTRNILEEVWDTEPADRFVKLAMNYKHLLTFEEERLWKEIREDPNLCHKGTRPDFLAIRKNWADLKLKFDIKE